MWTVRAARETITSLRDYQAAHRSPARGGVLTSVPERDDASSSRTTLIARRISCFLLDPGIIKLVSYFYQKSGVRRENLFLWLDISVQFVTRGAIYYTQYSKSTWFYCLFSLIVFSVFVHWLSQFDFCLFYKGE